MTGILHRTLRTLALATLIAGLAACADEGSLSGGFELSSLKLPSIELNLFGPRFEGSWSNPALRSAPGRIRGRACRGVGEREPAYERENL